MPSAPLPTRGRGARSNESGRYEAQSVEAFDDGWTPDDANPVKFATTTSPEQARVIISRNDSPDVGFSATINPYRGCEHGCIYCYARPAHAYMGLSPGLDFESKLFFKPHAAALLEAELRHPRYRPERIHIGGNTDPYQPEERKLGVTRSVVEVLLRYRHPFSVITKSALILRDLDLLAAAAELGLVRVAISVTSLDRKLARSMEPRAATPERRLAAITRLTAAGVPVTVMFAPAIPGLNDHEMETVLERAAGAGATGAGYVVGPADARRQGLRRPVGQPHARRGADRRSDERSLQGRTEALRPGCAQTTNRHVRLSDPADGRRPDRSVWRRHREVAATACCGGRSAEVCASAGPARRWSARHAGRPGRRVDRSRHRFS